MVAGSPVRKKNGAPVAMSWQELRKLGSADFWKDPRMAQIKAAKDKAEEDLLLKPRGGYFFGD
jgi:hypothetical protein